MWDVVSSRLKLVLSFLCVLLRDLCWHPTRQRALFWDQTIALTCTGIIFGRPQFYDELAVPAILQIWPSKLIGIRGYFSCRLFVKQCLLSLKLTVWR
ncbi:hypothetical protein EDD85DRAFT_862220 [Armillaria nabsnona]|nr:hypothetical protein EDD85DRAFT_862220 [Armillaria nabsnona]